MKLLKHIKVRLHSFFYTPWTFDRKSRLALRKFSSPLNRLKKILNFISPKVIKMIRQPHKNKSDILSTLLIIAFLVGLFNFSFIWGKIKEPVTSFISHILTLNNPVRIEEANPQEAFKYTDTPSFKLHTPQTNNENIGETFKGIYKNNDEQISAQVIHKGYRYRYPADIKKTAAGEFDVSFEKPRSFVPGDYVLEVSSKESFLYTRQVTQDFSWGVLSINTSKSIYTPGEEARLQMGVVDELGHTICDAKLTLNITNPLGQITTLSSEKSTVLQSGYCHGDSYVPVADYLAKLKTTSAGIYKIELTAKTRNGNSKTLKDQFEVRPSVPFDIERTSFPSRIYPPVDYPVVLTVKANQDFSGEIADFTPSEFEIDCKKDIPLPPNIKKGSDKDFNLNRNFCNTSEFELSKKISWQVSLKKGQFTQLFYTIKFPPVSPEFYLMGPVKIYAQTTSKPVTQQIGPDQFKTTSTISVKPQVIFEEARLWQIASDATLAIEQQINISTQAYTTSQQTDSPQDFSLGIVYYTEAVYNPIPLTYFEADLKNSNGGISTATLYDSKGLPVANSSVSAVGPDYTRVRSNRIYLVPGEYTVRLKSSEVSTASMSAARIIVVQNTFSSFNKTETQIEVGANETTASTSMTALTAPKYYKYDDGAWSPSPTAYFEATLKGLLSSTSVTNTADSPTCVNIAGAGVDWSTPENAESNNDSNAYATASLDGTTTDYLSCTSYDFAIDSAATILGIVVDIERKAGDAGEHHDSEVKLRDETTTIGTEDRATATTYTTSDVVEAHGTSSDLWGGSSSGAWTPAKINDADFGVAFKATDNSSAGAAETDSVDAISVTVYYSLPVTAYAELYNRTNATVVTNSAISTASTNWTRVRGASALSTNWDTTNDDEYEVRIKSDNASGTIGISNAKIILQQSGADVTNLETYHNYINTQQTQSNAGGNIGAFATTSQAQLPAIRDSQATITKAIGDLTYVYVIGGWSGAAPVSTVYKGTLNSLSGNIGAFATTSQGQLLGTRNYPTSVIQIFGSSTYVYVIGGNDGNITGFSTVYKSTVDSITGNLSAFATTSQSQLPKVRVFHGSPVETIGSSTYVYVIGGNEGTNNQSSIYKATFDSTTGNVGAFDTTSQAQLLDPRNGPNTVSRTIGSSTYIYVIGGNDNTASTSTIFKATLNGTTGNTGAFSTTSQGQLLDTRVDPTSFIQTVGSSTYIYVVGGKNSIANTAHSTIYKATINSTTGDLGAFATTSQTQLPVIKQQATSIVQTIGSSVYLYVLGGNDNTTTVSTVYKAAISNDYDSFGFDNLYDPNNWLGGTFTYYHESTLKPTVVNQTGYARLTPGQLASISTFGGGTGDVGAFATTSQRQLPDVRSSHTTTSQTVASSTYLYVIGGEKTGGRQSTVYKAALDSTTGNADTFATTSQSQLPQIIQYHTTNSQTVGSSTYLYVIGGSDSTYFSTVYKATLDSTTGDVGAFATTSQAQLLARRRSHTTISQTVGSSTYLYVIGGYDGSYFSTVYKATLDSTTGDVGAFATTSQAQLLAIRAEHSITAQTVGSSTYLYVLGGTDGSYYSTVYKATLDSGTGNLGAFATTSQEQLLAIRGLHTTTSQTVGPSTYLYVIGGFSAAGTSTVYKASLDSTTGNVSTFATTSQAQLLQLSYSHTTTVGFSTYLYVIGGGDGGFRSTVYRATLGAGTFELKRSSSFSPDSDPGRLGAFSTTSQAQVPSAQSANSSVSANVGGLNYIYTLGGANSTVYKSWVDNSSGNASTFATTSQGQLLGVSSNQTAHNFINPLNASYIFTLGGKLSPNDPIGNIGAFATTSQSQLLVADGIQSSNIHTLGSSTYLYVIGGSIGALRSTIYKATLNSSTGDIGAFATTSQSQLLTTSYYHTSQLLTIGSSSYLYVVGGFIDTAKSTVYKATLDSGTGNIGTFATTSQSQLLTQSLAHTSPVLTVGSSTYLYVIGGGGGGHSNVYKATLNSSTGDIGTFATTSQSQLLVTNGSHSSNIQTIGSSTYLYVVGGDEGSYVSTVYKATLNSSTGDIGTFATTSQSQLPALSYAHTSPVLTVGSSTYLYVVGGVGSATLSTVYRATLNQATGDIGTFATTSQSQLLTKSYYHTSPVLTVGSSTYLYVIGNHNLGSGTSTVYKAAINADVAVSTVYRSQIDTSANAGAFATTSQAQLIQVLRNHASTITTKPDNYIYVLGGCNTAACASSDTVSTVYKATIDIPANVGAFATTSQAQLLRRLINFTSVTLAIGSSTYLYVAGGDDNGILSTFYKATINSTTGNVGTFATTSQAQLPKILSYHDQAELTIGSSTYLYVIGGSTGTIQSTVYKATFNSAGDIGTFATTSQGQLPGVIAAHSNNIMNFGSSTYLYVFGGDLGANDVSTVYKATFNSAGDIGTFATTSQGQLPQQIGYFESLTNRFGTSAYVYVIGGEAPSSTSTVFKASFNSAGDIGTFATTSQEQLPAARTDISAESITIGASTYIYVFGGFVSNTFFSNVYKATINSATGDVGAFATTSQFQLPDIRSIHETNVVNVGNSSYLYVIGGSAASVSGSRSTVYKAALDTNPNIQTFATTSQGQMLVRLRSVSSVSNTIPNGTTYVYTLGGLDSSDAVSSTIYRAASDSSGDLGAFATTSQAQLPAAMHSQNAILTKIGETGFIYVIGGCSTAACSSSSLSTIYRASINSSSGNIGTFASTNQGQLPQLLNSLSSVTLRQGQSDYMYILGGDNSGTSQSTVYRSTVTNTEYDTEIQNAIVSSSWLVVTATLPVNTNYQVKITGGTIIKGGTKIGR